MSFFYPISKIWKRLIPKTYQIYYNWICSPNYKNCCLFLLLEFDEFQKSTVLFFSDLSDIKLWCINYIRIIYTLCYTLMCDLQLRLCEAWLSPHLCECQCCICSCPSLAVHAVMSRLKGHLCGIFVDPGSTQSHANTLKCFHCF